MTLKDFAAYVGAAIFVAAFATLFLVVPARIFGFLPVIGCLCAAAVTYFSVWGFVTVADKHGKKTAEDFRKKLEDCKHPTHKIGGVNVNPDPTYPKPPAPPSPPAGSPVKSTNN